MKSFDFIVNDEDSGMSADDVLMEKENMPEYQMENVRSLALSIRRTRYIFKTFTDISKRRSQCTICLSFCL